MFAIELAGVPIAVSARYPLMSRLCRDFAVSIPVNKCVFSIAATDNDITSVKDALSRFDSLDEGYGNSSTYTHDYYECIALYLQACDRLIEFDTMFLHAAIIEHKGFAYAFAAPSGTGKSTHIKLWLENCKDATKVINGDKPLIRLENDLFIVYGSPLMGKEGWGTNSSAPLKAICFLDRADHDCLQPLFDESVILEKLSRQLHYPKGQSAAIRQLELLDKLIRKIQFFTLKCTTNPSAFDEAFKMTLYRNE